MIERIFEDDSIKEESKKNSLNDRKKYIILRRELEDWIFYTLNINKFNTKESFELRRWIF